MPTVLDSLNTHLHQAMASDARVYLIGEDLLDPYGGAFKVSRGLSTKYPDRVLTTPVSEAGILGVAAGMALRGLRPVVEIMFGDFITLIADQLVNSLAKFGWMYGGALDVPLVIRAPMGGRRGYGPTHSQTLEKLYLGVPGLRVLAPCAFGNPGELLARAIEDNQPVLFIENKLLYLVKMVEPDTLTDFTLTAHTLADSYAPVYRLSLRDAPVPVLTITAYGYMAELARQAVERLTYDHEIFSELIVPTQLAPFGPDGGLPPPLLDSIQKTHRLLAVEEGNRTLGWGAEILARAAETLGTNLRAAARVAAQDTPIPASPPLEQATLPGVDDIIAAARRMV